MDVFLIACLGIVAALVGVALRKHPRAAITLWIAVMISAPCWIVVKAITTLPPMSIAFALIIHAILHAADQRVTKVDLLLAGFTVVAAIAMYFADTPQYAFATLVVQWLPAYWVGRYLAPAAGKEWVYRAVGVAATIVGVWALVEFVFGIHLFKDFLGTDASAGWQDIQIRGVFTRSEGAFGHSIAMGAFLAIGLPFIIAGRFTPFKRIMMIAVVCAGVIVTFSRGALVGALIVFVLCVLFLPTAELSRKTRQFLFGLLALASATLVPYLLSLFDTLSYDLDPSTQYRENLLTYIFQDMNPLGPAEGMSLMPNGRYFYRAFGSIDNAYVLTVLQFGWVPLVFLLLGLVAVGCRVVFTKRGGPADIAMVGQIWVMSTVALITQYGMAVWFCAGMAVAFGMKPAQPQPTRQMSMPARPLAAGSVQ